MKFWMLLFCLLTAVRNWRYGSCSMRRDLVGFDGGFVSEKAKRSVEGSGEGASESLDTSERDRL